MAESSGVDEWSDDRLGRKEDAVFLRNFLIERLRERKALGLPCSYVLNLDAGWGRGKTFFLNRFQKTLEKEGYLVTTVNAWRDDHADDPIIAVMAAIDAAVSPHIKNTEKKIWQAVKSNAAAVAIAAVKGGLKHWAEKAIGEGAKEIAEVLQANSLDDVDGELKNEAGKILDKTAESLLKHFSATQKSIDGFKRELEKLLQSIGGHGKNTKLPLFVIVDEVDRCRPTYAITLLERVKHLFEIDDVVFIVATDTAQLRHSIRAVYGESFDAERYLFRFFDRTYRFEEPSRAAFIKALLNRSPVDERKISLPEKWTIEKYLTEALDFFNLSLRDSEQCIDIFRTALTAWNIAFPVEVVVLFPLIVGFQQGINSAQSEYFNGLRQIAVDNGSDLNGWEFDFQGFTTVGGEVKPQRLNGLALCEIFRKHGQKSFYQLAGEGEGGLPPAGECWVLDRLEKEQKFLSDHNQKRRLSMTNDLPLLVRSAGRLTPI